MVILIVRVKKNSCLKLQLPQQNFVSQPPKRVAPPPPRRTITSSNQQNPKQQALHQNHIHASSNIPQQWVQQTLHHQQPFSYTAAPPHMPQTYLTSGFLDYGR